MDTSEYCRQIEAHLCQKNDGHLIRVVGPSFERVASWANDGVPLKVALRGIDRYFERYYRKGPRRRPVRVEFCEADVLDVFDEWRRAVGASRPGDVADPSAEPAEAAHGKTARSLPAHLERAVIGLTNLRATGALGPDADDVIDRVSRELDHARSAPGGLRGPARQAVIARLSDLDAEILQIVRAGLSAAEQARIEKDADDQLAVYRQAMAPEAYLRARQAAIDNLSREQVRLPVIAFH